MVFPSSAAVQELAAELTLRMDGKAMFLVPKEKLRRVPSTEMTGTYCYRSSGNVRLWNRCCRPVAR